MYNVVIRLVEALQIRRKPLSLIPYVLPTVI